LQRPVGNPMEQRAAAQLMARGGGDTGIIGSGDSSRADAADRMAIASLANQAGRNDYSLAGMLGVGAQLEGTRARERASLREDALSRAVLAQEGLGIEQPYVAPRFNPSDPGPNLAAGAVEKALSPGTFSLMARNLGGEVRELFREGRNRGFPEEGGMYSASLLRQNLVADRLNEQVIALQKRLDRPLKESEIRAFVDKLGASVNNEELKEVLAGIATGQRGRSALAKLLRSSPYKKTANPIDIDQRLRVIGR